MFDFIDILKDSTRYNFHSHTEFCDGRAQMQAFAAEVVSRGFTHYGFSPHSPVPIVSPCNMHPDNVPVYLDEVKRIKELYPTAATNFYASMEIDYLGPSWGAATDYFQKLPLDYRISSVHFVKSQQGDEIDIDGRYESFRRNMERHFHNDLRYVVEKYFERSIEMVELGGFDLIGHLDKISLNASYHDPDVTQRSWYKALEKHLADSVSSAGITVELNTKHYKEHGRFFPAPELLDYLKHKNVPIIVNSDAHVPALVDASRAEGLELLKK